MKLLGLLSLAAGASAAYTCAVQGTGDGQCRSCPASVCEIKYRLPTSTSLSVLCVWQQGEYYQNDSNWVYMDSMGCFLWAPRTTCKVSKYTPSTPFLCFTPCATRLGPRPPNIFQTRCLVASSTPIALAPASLGVGALPTARSSRPRLPGAWYNRKASKQQKRQGADKAVQRKKHIIVSSLPFSSGDPFRVLY